MTDLAYLEIIRRVDGVLTVIADQFEISREDAAKGVVSVCAALLWHDGEDLRTYFAEIEQDLRDGQH